MHSTTPRNSGIHAGFTLVEVLIIAPLALLVISGFIALMVTLTGDVLASSARTKLIERTDFTLERFEQDARFAKEFRATSFAPTSPQGRNDNSSPFDVMQYAPPSNNSYYGTVRILRSYATDKNPLDPNKSLIYTTSVSGVVGAGSADCGSSTTWIRNDPLEFDIVYYVKYSSGSAAENNLRYSLWRRIIFHPTQIPCPGQASSIWQKSTCAPAASIGVGKCQAEDEKVIDNLIPGGFGGYYANQPDQSATLGRPDCIRACPHGLELYDGGTTSNGHAGHVAGDENNILIPTSSDGLNARATYLYLSTQTTVAGRNAEYSAGVYARRSN